MSSGTSPARSARSGSRKSAERDVCRDVQRDARRERSWGDTTPGASRWLSILQSLNDEWSALASAAATRRAVMRWTRTHPYSHPPSISTTCKLGHSREESLRIRRALAALAPTDKLAASG